MVKHVYRLYIYTLFIHTNEFICIPRVFAMATVHFWAQVQIASRPPSRAGPRRLELGWTSIGVTDMARWGYFSDSWGYNY